MEFYISSGSASRVHVIDNSNDGQGVFFCKAYPEGLIGDGSLRRELSTKSNMRGRVFPGE